MLATGKQGVFFPKVVEYVYMYPEPCILSVSNLKLHVSHCFVYLWCISNFAQIPALQMYLYTSVLKLYSPLFTIRARYIQKYFLLVKATKVFPPMLFIVVFRSLCGVYVWDINSLQGRWHLLSVTAMPSFGYFLEMVFDVEQAANVVDCHNMRAEPLNLNTLQVGQSNPPGFAPHTGTG